MLQIKHGPPQNVEIGNVLNIDVVVSLFVNEENEINIFYLFT